MAQTQAELTQGEKIILKTLETIADREKLISEHILSLEKVLGQLLAELARRE